MRNLIFLLILIGSPLFAGESSSVGPGVPKTRYCLGPLGGSNVGFAQDNWFGRQFKVCQVGQALIDVETMYALGENQKKTKALEVFLSESWGAQDLVFGLDAIEKIAESRCLKNNGKIFYGVARVKPSIKVPFCGFNDGSFGGAWTMAGGREFFRELERNISDLLVNDK